MAPKLYHKDRADPGAGRPPEASRRGARIEDGDVPQIPVIAVVVEAVAHHELVGNREADVVDGDLDLPTGHLVQEHAEREAPGMSGRQIPAQIGDGTPRVDDVLHDDHIPSLA